MEYGKFDAFPEPDPDPLHDNTAPPHPSWEEYYRKFPYPYGQVGPPAPGTPNWVYPYSPPPERQSIRSKVLLGLAAALAGFGLFSAGRLFEGSKVQEARPHQDYGYSNDVNQALYEDWKKRRYFRRKFRSECGGCGRCRCNPCDEGAQANANAAQAQGSVTQLEMQLQDQLQRQLQNQLRIQQQILENQRNQMRQPAADGWFEPPLAQFDSHLEQPQYGYRAAYGPQAETPPELGMSVDDYVNLAQATIQKLHTYGLY